MNVYETDELEVWEPGWIAFILMQTLSGALCMGVFWLGINADEHPPHWAWWLAFLIGCLAFRPFQFRRKRAR